MYQDDFNPERFVGRQLRTRHVRNSRAPLALPHETVLHGAWLDVFLDRGSRVVVIDANVLKSDIADSVRRNCAQTTLFTAMNVRALRVFCAQHVVEELHEHYEAFASQSRVSATRFMEQWKRYLRLLRIVPTRAIPLTLLSPEELAQVDTLSKTDPDDIPSVALSLVLGAAYLSEDLDARQAVYGYRVEIEEAARWLPILRAGGDSNELASMMTELTMLPTLAGAGITYGLQTLRAKAPWALVGIAVAATYGAYRIPRDAYRSIGKAALALFRLYGAVALPYYEAAEVFAQAAPSIPTWAELSKTNSRPAILHRACLHTLARAPGSRLTAANLVDALPHLGVAQGIAAVRKTLKESHGFTRLGRHWQLGEAWAYPDTP
jgi:predicted nucleic acid-binding protein